MTDATKTEKVNAPGGGVMRFAYATGSRPLDGYTIKRGIGVGGFGEVYFALSDAGKEVALKRVQRSMDVEVRGVSQCLNLKHPNLIALFDIKYDDEGQAWVVMEYVTGESLKDVTERNPNGMPLTEVANWFRGIAAGVAYLHDHGIVHRDLKPGNIFLDEDVVKIGDYGLSKYISCSRRSGQTESVGTFHYMAPEIGRGVYGKEIDIYALGIILFEMLTGRVPFDGESSQEIIMKHLTAEPDVSAVPEPFRPLIRKSLFKDPDQRYGSAAEMLAAFESSLRADPSPQRKPPIRRPQPAPSETLYIADEDEGIYLGPLKEVAAPVAASSHGPASRPRGSGAPAEPLAKAVRGGWGSAVSWWQQSHMTTPVKLVILLVIGLVVVLNSEWLVPMAVLGGAAYLVYFGIFTLATAGGGPAASGARREAPSADSLRRRSRRKWQDQARLALRGRHATERLAELNGSFLMSAIIVSVLCFLLMFIANRPLDDSVYNWTLYAWFALTGVAASWTVLAVAKPWEGHDGDQFRRRFVLLLAGVVVGALAFAASEFLDVRRAGYLALDGGRDAGIWSSMYSAQGQPGLPVFLIHFAALFLVFRWWLQADPLRTSRLGIITTGGCILWAWVLHLIWPFPQPWGIMLAAVVSIAVQLSSPCLSSQERHRFRREALEA